MSGSNPSREQFLGALGLVFKRHLRALYQAEKLDEARALERALTEVSPDIHKLAADWMFQHGPWLAMRARMRASEPSVTTPERSEGEELRARLSRPSDPRKNISGGLQRGASDQWDESVWLPLLHRSAAKLRQGTPVMSLPYWRRAREAALKLLRHGVEVSDLEAAVTKAVELRRRDTFAGYNNLAYIWGSGFQVIMAERQSLTTVGGAVFREQPATAAGLTPQEAEELLAKKG